MGERNILGAVMLFILCCFVLLLFGVFGVYNRDDESINHETIKIKGEEELRRAKDAISQAHVTK